MITAPKAKRLPPKDVPPVMIGTTRIEVIHWSREQGFGQNGGVLRAVDAKTGAELWTLKVYDVTYDERMESDVQDVFIKTLKKSLFGGKLIVVDENDCRYEVDPVTRAVTRK